MAATTINLPLYQVLTELKVPEDRARQAAEASIPDLSAFATRDDLKTALDGLEQRLGRTIAEKTDGQTQWIAAIAASTIIILLSSSAWLWPPTRFPGTSTLPPAVTVPQH